MIFHRSSLAVSQRSASIGVEASDSSWILRKARALRTAAWIFHAVANDPRYLMRAHDDICCACLQYASSLKRCIPRRSA